MASDDAPPVDTMKMQSHTMIVDKDEGTRGNRKNPSPRQNDNVWDVMAGAEEEQG